MSAFALPLAIGLLAEVAQAQQTDFFINPPSAGPETLFLDNPVYAIGEEVEVRWSTDLEQYSIGMWQQSPGISVATVGPNVYSKIPGGPEEGAFNWTADTLGFSLSQSNVFYFNLSGPRDGENSVLTSHYFNLTSTAATTTTTSTSTSISNSDSAPGSTTAPSASPGPTLFPPPNTTSDDTDSDESAKVGLGVGLGLGIPLLALITYLGFLYRKRGRHSHASHRSPAPLYSQQRPTFEGPDAPKELPAAPNHPRGDVPKQHPERYRDHNEPVELEAEWRNH